MNIWRDRDNKLSFNRIVATIFVLVALVFLGKAWYIWDALPSGMDTTLILFYAVTTGAIKASDFIIAKKESK